MGPVFHIARNTFREALREPIFLILQMSSVTLIGLHPLMALFVFREQEKLVTDGSMAVCLLFGWVTAVLCASHTVAREIDAGTASLILSKPVGRLPFLLAKNLGILAVLTVSTWINAAATLMALRCATDQFRFDTVIFSMAFVALGLAVIYGGFRNLTKKKNFPATAALATFWLMTLAFVVVWFLPEKASGGYQWGEHVGYPGNLVKALLLIQLAVYALGSLAVCLSTRFTLVTTLLIVFGVFILGLLSDFLFGRLLDLRQEELERAMHVWYLALVPVVVVAWFTLVRKRTQSGRIRGLWRWHLAAVLVVLSLSAAAIHNRSTEAYLDELPGYLQAAGVVVMQVKDVTAHTLRAVIPNWQLFWQADALTANKDIPFGYVVYGGVYVGLFAALFLLFAWALFATREVGTRSSF